MAAELNHTIVWCSDQSASARFLAEMLGRPAPTRFGHFDVVELDNGVSLDFADAEGPIRSRHYAFLIGEADFDAVFGRIKDRNAATGAAYRRPSRTPFVNGAPVTGFSVHAAGPGGMRRQRRRYRGADDGPRMTAAREASMAQPALALRLAPVVTF